MPFLLSFYLLACTHHTFLPAQSCLLVLPVPLPPFFYTCTCCLSLLYPLCRPTYYLPVLCTPFPAYPSRGDCLLMDRPVCACHLPACLLGLPTVLLLLTALGPLFCCCYTVIMVWVSAHLPHCTPHPLLLGLVLDRWFDFLPPFHRATAAFDTVLYYRCVLRAQFTHTARTTACPLPAMRRYRYFSVRFLPVPACRLPRFCCYVRCAHCTGPRAVAPAPRTLRLDGFSPAAPVRSYCATTTVYAAFCRHRTAFVLHLHGYHAWFCTPPAILRTAACHIPGFGFCLLPAAALCGSFLRLFCCLPLLSLDYRYLVPALAARMYNILLTMHVVHHTCYHHIPAHTTT